MAEKVVPPKTYLIVFAALMALTATTVGFSRLPLSEDWHTVIGLGIAAAAEQREVVRQPERAGQELPLTRRQAVHLRARRVAGHEAVLHQLALDRLDRPLDARVRGGQEADQRDIQQGGVEILGPVILHEGVAARIVALGADLAVDRGTRLPPAVHLPVAAEALDRLDHAVKGHPG